MKKLLIALAACAAIAGYSATHEENVKLAATPLDKITEDNVQAVSDALVATTNYWKLLMIREKGLLTFDQVSGLILGKPRSEYILAKNAVASSNGTLIVQAFDAIATSPNVPVIRQLIQTRAISLQKQVSAADSAARTGNWTTACNILYGFDKILNGTADEAAYRSACAQRYETFSTGWNGYPMNRNFHTDGGTVVQYGVKAKKANIDSLAGKCIAYVNKGEKLNFWKFRANTRFIRSIRKAILDTNAISPEDKIDVARFEDKIAGNKNATIALFPKLTADKDKVQAALYLDDVDKLIDTLKVVGDTLDASLVAQTIAPLNDVNAGYRTADLKLALMNINKKYTIKLYNDRESWEPILSKIRAMIDTL